MRARHFMESDYNEDLRSEIITLLTAVSAEGVNEIDTQNLLNDLEAQGYAIDQQSLMNILDELEVVAMATGDKITIATSDADMMVGQDAKDVEQDQVDNMATNQATKDLGEDAERLNVGDPVIITGDVNHHGETGEISAFGRDKMFVIVNLYNFGKATFQSSDVEFNDYADSDEEDEDLRNMYGDDYADKEYYEGKIMSDTNRLRQLAGVQNKPLSEAMAKPKPGQRFGANDTGAPEEYSEEQLSRAADLLYYAGTLGVEKEVWAALPRNLKVEWNYANWSYVPDRG